MVEDLEHLLQSHQFWINGGLVVGWISTIVKWLVDRRKWRLEKEKHAAEQHRRLNEYVESHGGADNRFAECSRAFRAALESWPTDKENVRAARDELCRALNNLVSRYTAYLDFFCLVHRDDADRLSSLCDNTVRDVRIWHTCQKNVNSPNVMSVVGGGRFRISRHSLEPIRHSISKVRPRRDAKAALEAELGRLVEADLR
jgi:hypothetical protein